MPLFKRYIKGFTLIELLIVIAIIGILAVAFIPQVLDAPSKARDTQRIVDVAKLANLITSYSATGEIDNMNTGWNCLAPDGGTWPANWYALAAEIDTDYLEDLNGVFPEDPDETWGTYQAGHGFCAGSYLMYARAGCNPVVFARVELEENGNSAGRPTSCSPDLGGDTGAYYGVTVQIL